jgi:hypothetical protein
MTPSLTWMPSMPARSYSRLKLDPNLRILILSRQSSPNHPQIRRNEGARMRWTTRTRTKLTSQYLKEEARRVNSPQRPREFVNLDASDPKRVQAQVTLSHSPCSFLCCATPTASSFDFFAADAVHSPPSLSALCSPCSLLLSLALFLSCFI